MAKEGKLTDIEDADGNYTVRTKREKLQSCEFYIGVIVLFVCLI